MQITNYFGVYICPKTNRLIYKYDTKKEVCPYCGFMNPNLDNHYRLVSVHEERYNIFENIFLGKRNTLICKDDPNLIIVR